LPEPVVLFFSASNQRFGQRIKRVFARGMTPSATLPIRSISCAVALSTYWPGCGWRLGIDSHASMKSPRARLDARLAEVLALTSPVSPGSLVSLRMLQVRRISRAEGAESTTPLIPVAGSSGMAGPSISLKNPVVGWAPRPRARKPAAAA